MSISDGFFETLRRYNGNWVALDQHFLRAQKSVLALAMQWPENLSKVQFEHHLDQVVANIQNDAVVRVIFNRKSGAGYYPETNIPQVDFILRSNTVSYPNALLSWGSLEEIRQLIPIRVGMFHQSCKTRNPWSFVKSTSAQLFTMAAIDCKNRNLDDLIILNEVGNLCELVYSNLIVEIEGRFFSPGIENGAVDGTFLKLISEKLKIEYRSLQPEHLLFADNIYRCNSVRGIERIQII